MASRAWLLMVCVASAAAQAKPHLPLASALKQPQHDVPGAFRTTFVNDAIQGLDPFVGLLGVDIGELARQAVADHRPFALGSGHSYSSWVK